LVCETLAFRYNPRHQHSFVTYVVVPSIELNVIHCAPR
jgi:hypothetical protein